MSQPSGPLRLSTTLAGAAVAGANMAIEPGQKVLVLEAQFPSNYYVWQRLAARDGGDLKIVPWPEDGDWTAAVLDALGDALVHHGGEQPLQPGAACGPACIRVFVVLCTHVGQQTSCG